MTHYYYHQDHLGNICAVWDATHDSIVQQTLYYASGLPVSVSTGQDVQPYKYNGKEYVEMHGYDVYEYGARGYYATIGRFTSIDPLCEQTPWQSPYVYANNNWVNNIDWMGMSADGFHVPTLNWVAVDGQGKVLGYDMQHPDQYVYLIDDKNWDGSYDGLSDYSVVGWQIPFVTYSIGRQCPFIALDLSGIYTHVPGGTFSFVPCLINNGNNDIESLEVLDWERAVTIIGSLGEVVGNATVNELYWLAKNGKFCTFLQRQNNYVYSRSYELAKKRPIIKTGRAIGKIAGGISMFALAVDVTKNGFTPTNTADIIATTLSFIPGVGWVIGGCYCIADITCMMINNQSLGDCIYHSLKTR